MNYFRPETFEDYFNLADRFAGKPYTLLAGGTDLLPFYEAGSHLPDTVIDIKHLPGLAGIRENDRGLEVGALTTMQELYKSLLIRERHYALWQAANHFAGVQIRHRGTLGGNICNASPAGDTLPALYAAGAKVRLKSRSGERILPIDQFILGPRKTVLQPGEILSAILFDGQNRQSTFFKLGLRQAMAIAVMNFAVSYRVDSGRFAELQIAAGAVAPTVVHLRQYETAVLEDPANIVDKSDLIEAAISPIDDIRASAWYRRTVLKNMLVHTLLEILNPEGDHDE